MTNRRRSPRTVDEYISGFPEDVQRVLERVRLTITRAVPDAKERISYGMPAFEVNGAYFVSIGAWKRHIALYPVPTGSAAFSKRLRQYRSGAGTLRFTLDKPMPYGLIARIAKALRTQRSPDGIRGQGAK